MRFIRGLPWIGQLLAMQRRTGKAAKQAHEASDRADKLVQEYRRWSQGLKDHP
jgi:hypothetical protein